MEVLWEMAVQEGAWSPGDCFLLTVSREPNSPRPLLPEPHQAVHQTGLQGRQPKEEQRGA